MISREMHKHIPSWLLITAAVFVSIATLGAVGALVLSETHANTIMPGISVAGEKIGGKTPAQVRTIIDQTITRLREEKISVRYEQKTVTIPPTPDDALSPESGAVDLISYDSDETLRRAWSIGHEESTWFDRSSSQLQALFFGRDIFVEASDNGVQAYLEKQFGEFNRPAKNAGIEFENNTPRLTDEVVGKTLDFQTAAALVMKSIIAGRSEEVVIEAKIDQPQVSASEVHGLLEEADSFLSSLSPSELVYDKTKWKLNNEVAKNWLGFKKENRRVSLALDTDKITEWLEKEVAPKINSEPVEARLAMEGGRVSVWQAGQDGKKVNLEETAMRIAAWPETQPSTIEAVTELTPGGSADATAEELGLKEIIGTGLSQFSGSPANRRHNIRTGANALHGLLIKPGEEFSLLAALGEIDGKHGYLPELVIKENKTTPEYGGGLCQIGTTMFRATYNSGLPVTQRRNHSYRVVYYEPAGTDATIYDPAPDYRFVNDTGHYILIQARIAGDQLAFDFWGTKDGRQVEYTKPTIYNIVAPGPTKIIETTDLPEGQKKCTEKAHNGADAYFDYKVTYTDGQVKEKRFSSHYVPWQAVCLVGAKKTPEGGTPQSPTGTITPAVSPAP